jgi:hypothetical protein
MKKQAIKKLDLRRETVAKLRVKSGMRMGGIISAGPAADGAAKVGGAVGGANLV